LRWSERSELSSGAAFPDAFSYACAKPATELLRAGTTLPFDDRMVKFEQLKELVGLPMIRASEEHVFLTMLRE